MAGLSAEWSAFEAGHPIKPRGFSPLWRALCADSLVAVIAHYAEHRAELIDPTDHREAVRRDHYNHLIYLARG